MTYTHRRENIKYLLTYSHGCTKGEKFHGCDYKNILLVMKKLFDFMQGEKGLEVRKYYHFGKLVH